MHVPHEQHEYARLPESTASAGSGLDGVHVSLLSVVQSLDNETIPFRKFRLSLYNTVTDLIEALPGNSFVNMF
jgi:hypothetical protein